MQRKSHKQVLVFAINTFFNLKSMDTPPPPSYPLKPPSPASFMRRKDFPPGFVFGSATSHFQIEGALKEGNRSKSNWDDFANERGIYGKYHEDSVGHYYRFKEDIQILKDAGFDAYRFSIAWTRVMKDGKEPNEEGITFYDQLINELVSHGIEPYVTLWHFDHPKAFEDEYGGWLNSRMAEDFAKFADLCFSRFGDKVKHWITLNEPSTYILGGYVNYNFPGRQKRSVASPGFVTVNRVPFAPSLTQQVVGVKRTFDDMSKEGGGTVSVITKSKDPSRDPYDCAHNLILAHAKVVKLYREKYQESQKGEIGVTLVTFWYVPYSDLPKDIEAAHRALDFMLGWFLDPFTNGDYPEIMRKYVGDRLPKFTAEESEIIKGSYDFLGLNYYTAQYAADNPYSEGGDYNSDPRVSTYVEKDGVPIGEPTGAYWLYIYPRGFLDYLLYVKNKYHNPPIYITENGMMELDDSSKSLWESCYDYHRIAYYHDHLWYMLKAMWLCVNVKGYFAWSLIDNLEWDNGYNYRFGMNFVDYKDGESKGSRRYPKFSFGWFKFLLQN